MDLFQAFLNILPAHKQTSKGWYTFCCPLCGDTRGRGALIQTPTNGLRYTCRNGGCTFNTQPGGWEPGSYLSKRLRDLYTRLGGHLTDLSIDVLLAQRSFFKNEAGLEVSEDAPIRFFPEKIFTFEVIDLFDEHDHPDFNSAKKYVLERWSHLKDYIYGWSPAYPKMFILPYIHHNKMVGWMMRTFEGKRKYIRQSPVDYLFNQHIFDRNMSESSLILVEGEMDALSVNGVACCGTTLGKKQELLLKECSNDIVVLPDFAKDGLNLIEIARRNDWFVSTPDWDLNVKDASEAVNRYGELYTISSIYGSKHKNYLKAEMRAKLAGK